MEGVPGREGRVFTKLGVPSPTTCQTSPSPAWELRRGKGKEEGKGQQEGDGGKEGRKSSAGN